MLEIIGWIIGLAAIARLLQAPQAVPKDAPRGFMIFLAVAGSLAVAGLLVALHVTAADIASKEEALERARQIDGIFHR